MRRIRTAPRGSTGAGLRRFRDFSWRKRGWREFDGDIELGRDVETFLGHDHELSRGPGGDPRLLQPDGDVLRIDIGAKIGHREIGPAEDIDEGQVANAAPAVPGETRQRIKTMM